MVLGDIGNTSGITPLRLLPKPLNFLPLLFQSAAVLFELLAALRLHCFVILHPVVDQPAPNRTD
jgi:hypothetical protein